MHSQGALLQILQVLNIRPSHIQQNFWGFSKLLHALEIENLLARRYKFQYPGFENMNIKSFITITVFYVVFIAAFLAYSNSTSTGTISLCNRLVMLLGHLLFTYSHLPRPAVHCFQLVWKVQSFNAPLPETITYSGIFIFCRRFTSVSLRQMLKHETVEGVLQEHKLRAHLDELLTHHLQLVVLGRFHHVSYLFHQKPVSGLQLQPW